ncbi:MAG: 7-cyano-7-deazaguanine synthase QueC [Planctomycetes bacterium]|nr:7-cyano-7-deazaguanine synthase QueC [Planctomycetota bacterium]
MDNATKTRAVVLLSGGLDSATAAAIARDDGMDVFPLAIRYGQRHEIELRAAAVVAEKLKLQPLRIVSIDLRAIGGSVLTGGGDVPKNRKISAAIPPTYVPARNTIFLSIALAYAESIRAWNIYIGANAIDYSGYPDCRGEFLEAFERMAVLATKAAVEERGTVRIRAPLLQKTKREIVLLAIARGVPVADTHSCYDPSPDGGACGSCDSCILRAKGFAEAGVPDATRYARRES